MLLQAVLSNGLRVFLVEDHDVPLVKASLLFRGGLRTSPPDKVMRPMMCLLYPPAASLARLSDLNIQEALHAVHEA